VSMHLKITLRGLGSDKQNASQNRPRCLLSWKSAIRFLSQPKPILSKGIWSISLAAIEWQSIRIAASLKQNSNLLEGNLLSGLGTDNEAFPTSTWESHKKGCSGEFRTCTDPAGITERLTKPTRLRSNIARRTEINVQDIDRKLAAESCQERCGR
jgi:hypothetical protein